MILFVVLVLIIADVPIIVYKNTDVSLVCFYFLSLGSSFFISTIKKTKKKVGFTHYMGCIQDLWDLSTIINGYIIIRI